MTESLRGQLKLLGALVLDALPVRTSQTRTLEGVAGEPPVVARVMVEIRSDGTRTIARGALEDLVTGERHALEAHGSTPLHLARSLVRDVLTLPLLRDRLRRALSE